MNGSESPNARFKSRFEPVVSSLRLVSLLMVGGLSAAAWAADGDLDAGGEFLVHEDTLLGRSDVAVNKHGEFIIVYDQPTLSPDGTRVSRGPVLAQRYDRAGQALGTPYKISSLMLGNPPAPAVALHHKGHSVTVWSATQPEGVQPDIWGRCHDAAGKPIGDEFLVNVFPPGIHGQADVGMDDLGNFVVTWTQSPLTRGTNNVAQDGSGAGVFARRYDWRGAPLGDEFPVHTITAGDQTGSRIAMDHLGNFVVAWTSPDGVNANGGTSSGIFARRFDRFGVPIGAEFLVNEHMAENQAVRGIASDAAGRFAVLWVGAGPETDGGGVYVRLFDETGTPRTGQVRVNPITTLPFESLPGVAISVEKKGNFIVTWDNSWNSAASVGIFGRVFDPIGAPLTAVFEVSAPDVSRLANGAVGLNKHGQLLVSWLSSGLTPSPVSAVFGRFFQVNLPGNPEQGE